MKADDCFRLALAELIAPHGAQARLADDLGIKRTILNDYLGGRKNFSEDRKEAIAIALGWRYEDIIALGRHLSQGGTIGTYGMETSEAVANGPVPDGPHLYSERDGYVVLTEAEANWLLSVFRGAPRQRGHPTEDADQGLAGKKAVNGDN